jgi:hypothetical protein
LRNCRRALQKRSPSAMLNACSSADRAEIYRAFR